MKVALSLSEDEVFHMSTPNKFPTSVFKDSRTYLSLIIGLSLLYFFTALIITSLKRTKRIPDVALADSEKPAGFVNRNNGTVALLWGLVRLVGLLVLTGMFGVSCIESGRSVDYIVEGLVAATVGYLSILSFLSIFVFPSPSTVYTRCLKLHIVLGLLAIFGVFFARDIFPLLTFTLSPEDNLKDNLTVIKLAIISAISLLPPAFTAPRYEPADPEYPSSPTKEQRASLASKMMFFFLDEQIWSGWFQKSISFEQLPPLADVDQARILSRKYLHILDPLDKNSPSFKRQQAGKKTHLGWRLLRIWWPDIAWSMLACFISVAFECTLSLRVRDLLRYIETNGEGAFLKPWLLVLSVGLWPMFQSLFNGISANTLAKAATRCESVMTQLIFQYTLKLQLREETTVKDMDGKEVKASNLVGRINNLISSDLDTVIGGRSLSSYLVSCGAGIAICIWALWEILGWSSLVGVALIFVTLPLPVWMTFEQSDTQAKLSAAADARVQRTDEALNSLRVTKMMGQEERVKIAIKEFRELELTLNRKRLMFFLYAEIASFALPLVIMATTFGVYTLVQKGELNASTVFSAIAAFGKLGHSTSIIFWFSMHAAVPVSLQRLNTFLQDAELLDRYSDPSAQDLTENANYIGFKSAVFSWSKSPLGEVQRNFKLHIDDLQFKVGKINVISGSTGSGKTSLLMALLGEMHFEKRVGSFFNLPRAGGVAFANQQSWLLNLTLRENILFGSPYDEERYKNVLNACALEKDFSLFEAGDGTEVGEKGITLSGGQKARVTLARAIYSPAKVLLLDDVLSALDVQTARWIIEKCFNSDLVANHFVVTIEDGRVKTQGSLDETLKSDSGLVIEDQQDQINEEIADDIDLVEGELGEKPLVKLVSDGKLIVAEEKAEGTVSARAIGLLTSSLGGVMFWCWLLFSLFLQHGFAILSRFWMGQWATAYDSRSPSEVPASFYLAVYCLLVMAGAAFMSSAFATWQYGAVRSGVTIHRKLLDSVFCATFRFLDTTPTGRILSRFTTSIKSLDGEFTEMTFTCLYLTVMLAMELAAISIAAPYFSIVGIFLMLVAWLLAQVFTHIQMNLKREYANGQSPLLTHISDCVAGIVSVRAYGAEAKFAEQGIIKLDRFMRSAVNLYSMNRWGSIRFNMISTVFETCLVIYLFYAPSAPKDAATIGFTLALSADFSSYILYYAQNIIQWQVSANAIERIQAMLDIEHERENMPQGLPPAYWPASGSVEVKNLTARYSKEGPLVLNNISFSVESGTRVGIVGRTGSGKSTLALALLSLIPTSGDVIIDGQYTSKLNLNSLRNSVTIIPQDPVLYSGTLRYNLDPTGENDDATLNAALKASGLFKLQSSSKQGSQTPGGHNITLDTQIAAGGENLSVGQKQIIALARGLIRKSKIYILDEATASVDYQTDAQIQEAIRSELRGATLLTIAHRLRSIMDYDKIMVLGAGEILEFDTPKNLLSNKESNLFGLVEQSADSNELRELANR